MWKFIKDVYTVSYFVTGWKFIRDVYTVSYFVTGLEVYKRRIMDVRYTASYFVSL